MLTGIFGIERLQLSEDVVQEAMIRALQTWPYYGVPPNPPAWLMMTAKNLAIDRLRREKFFIEKQPEIITTVEQWGSATPATDDATFENELKDERLRLIFACCHPLIPAEDQTALALKTLCGFGPGEIAKAFLTTEAAIIKRLTRARQHIRENGVPFEIPEGAELSVRLDGVLQVVYLLFNEGYKASSGDTLVKEDVCFEAVRLASLLAEHPLTSVPRTHALLALMLFNVARLAGRVDPAGNLLRLKDQDRSTWNHSMIGLAMYHLAQAAGGEHISEYHLQAGIAACHCTAPDYASTDWPRIVGHYDQWTAMNQSPIVALNRAVAVAQVNGPKAGIAEVGKIKNRTALDGYYLTYAVLGDFEEQLEHHAVAAAHFRRAVELTSLKSEKTFLKKRLAECEGKMGGKSEKGKVDGVKRGK